MRSRKEIQKEVRKAEKILVGIGAEWKRGDEDREEQIRRASKALRELLEGKDAFIISTLTLGEMEDRGFEKEHMVTPLDVSLTEEQWNGYTGWLAGTLNRTTVLLELGEGFAHPSLIRWPFERDGSHQPEGTPVPCPQNVLSDHRRTEGKSRRRKGGFCGIHGRLWGGRAWQRSVTTGWGP